MPKLSTDPRDHVAMFRCTAAQLAALRRLAADDGASVSEFLRRIVSDVVRERGAAKPRGRGKR